MMMRNKRGLFKAAAFAGEIELQVKRAIDGTYSIAVVDVNEFSGGYRPNPDFDKMKRVLRHLKKSGLPITRQVQKKIIEKYKSVEKVKHLN